MAWLRSWSLTIQPPFHYGVDGVHIEKVRVRLWGELCPIPYLDLLGNSCPNVDTPMVKYNTFVHVEGGYKADDSTITWYQRAVSSLIYIMTEKWFDITYTVYTVCLFANNSTSTPVAAVKQFFRYLRKYPNLGIPFSQDKAFELEEHVDSDWGMDPNIWRSTTGYPYSCKGCSQCIIKTPALGHLILYQGWVRCILSSSKQSCMAAVTVKRAGTAPSGAKHTSLWQQ